MSKTKIALAGLGVIGRKHALAISKSMTCELTAVVDANPATGALAKQYRAAFHSSLEELFDNTKVDGVLLATPNAMHASQGIACADAALAGRIVVAAYERGVLVESSGPNDEVIKLLPPLTIPPETLKDGLSRLCDSVDALLASSGPEPASNAGG